MIEISAKPLAALLADLLFLALRSGDAALADHAAEVLGRTSGGYNRRLVAEAARCRNSTRDRLRALAVLERVAHLSGPDEWLDVSVLAARDKNPAVRHAAARCLVHCGPGVRGVATENG